MTNLVHPTFSAPSGAASVNDDTYHTAMVRGIPFTVLRSLAPSRLLGQGAYGVVCGARVAGSAEEVAIKKMAGALNEEASIIEGKRALREMLLLRHLQHENISCICDAWRARDPLQLQFLTPTAPTPILQLQLLPLQLLPLQLLPLKAVHDVPVSASGSI